MNETWWVGEHQLDDDQKNIISLPIDQDHLIFGPPGSGKTNLLLLRANYLHSGGYPNVLFLVFTRTLQEFLVSGAVNYHFSPSKIQTYTFWEKKFLGENGVTPAAGGDFETNRIALLRQLEELVERNGFENHYDAIVLDEAQDCLPEEIRLCKRLGKVLFVAADPKQQIYKTADSVAVLQSLIPNQTSLKYHYRCGRRICQVADALAQGSRLYQPMCDSCNYDEAARPSEARAERCSDLAGQCSRILNSLKVQLVAYPNELLGVLCPRREETEFVGRYLLQSEIGNQVMLQMQNDYSAFSPDKRVCVATISSAKGLEFRAVHVAAFEFVKKFRETQKKLAYTAVTRAKTTLTGYHSGDLPGYLESAFAAANPKPKLEISKAFGTAS